MREDTTLNRLARNRTVLANERTFLAYIRTSIMFAVSGITIIKFYADELYLLIGGVVLLAVGIACTGIGLVRYRTMGRLVEQTMPEPEERRDG